MSSLGSDDYPCGMGGPRNVSGPIAWIVIIVCIVVTLYMTINT